MCSALLECLVPLVWPDVACPVLARDNLASRRGHVRGRHLDNLAISAYDSVLLLDLQVSETPHRLRCHRAFRCLFEVAAVALCSKFEAVVQVDFVKIGRHLLEFGEGTVLRRRRAAGCEAGRCTSEYVNWPDHGSSTRT